MVNWIDLLMELTGSGVTFTACVFFFLVWAYFKKDAYRALAVLCLGSLAFTIFSAWSKLSFLTTRELHVAFEFYRARELVSTAYIIVLPYVLATTIKGPEKLKDFHKALIWLGIGSYAFFLLCAYLLPDSFLHDPFPYQPSGISTKTGVLYSISQAMLGIELLYASVIFIIDLRRWKSFGKIWSIHAGTILCAYLGISAISKDLLGFYLDPLPGLAFSRSVFGMILLSIFMAFGFFRVFLEQALDVSHSRDALEETESRLKQMLYTDDLTNLPNRRKFIADLRCSMEGGHEAAVILMDLDSFMEFNECFGSGTGDAVLKTVGGDIPLLLPAGARLYRMGGDEFSIILEKIHGQADVASIAHSIKERISRGLNVGGKSHSFGLAMSLARVPHDGETPEEALSNAYSALNEAKRNRNSICDYSDVLKREALVRISTVQKLRESLHHGAFHMLYQPIHDKLGAVSSIEALLRWEPLHNEDPISPDLFIPLLESSGLMPEMGDLILRLILNDLGEELGLDRKFPLLSINLSPHQLKADGLGRDLAETFSIARIPLSRLQFEVTESAFLDRAGVSVSNLSYLRDRGASIAVDDFGTGYSNLGYIRSLPIDKIKIDKCFINSVPGDRSAEGLISALADIAKTFGLSLVAEGVETKEQLDFLLARGYDEIQGFYFSKPLSSSDLLKYLGRQGMGQTSAS